MSHLRGTTSYDNEAGGVYQNVFNYETSPDVPAVPDVLFQLDLLNTIGAIYTPLIASWTDGTSLNNIRWELWDAVTETWNLYHEASVVGLVGSGITHALPAGVAGLVSAVISGGGRSGRKYFGGLSEDTSIDGFWGLGSLAALLAAGAVWVAGSSGGAGITLLPEVFHQITKTFSLLMVDVSVDATPSYQTRRKPGVGI